MATLTGPLKDSIRLGRLDGEAQPELNGPGDDWGSAHKRAGAPPPGQISSATKRAVKKAESDEAWKRRLQSGGENKG